MNTAKTAAPRLCPVASLSGAGRIRPVCGVCSMHVLTKPFAVAAPGRESGDIIAMT